MDTYDLVVIGSGPAGQKSAIAAAKLGYRAAIVDRGNMMGGVCINTGTIPSKTLREAVLYLTGLSQRELYGQAYRASRTSPSPMCRPGSPTWSIERSTSFAISLPAITSR